jgi:hypothetical protein
LQELERFLAQHLGGAAGVDAVAAQASPRDDAP